MLMRYIFAGGCSRCKGGRGWCSNGGSRPGTKGAAGGERHRLTHRGLLPTTPGLKTWIRWHDDRQTHWSGLSLHTSWGCLWGGVNVVLRRSDWPWSSAIYLFPKGQICHSTVGCKRSRLTPRAYDYFWLQIVAQQVEQRWRGSLAVRPRSSICRERGLKQLWIDAIRMAVVVSCNLYVACACILYHCVYAFDRRPYWRSVK